MNNEIGRESSIYSVLPYLKTGTTLAIFKQFGKVEIPQEAFIGVLKINKET